ncbi:MAG: GTP-binding protein [Promethearchaeota archaeon]|nr:MAG: GTP-binding protein [Candidatus Lokiarchaeota archaeon]
MVTRLLFKIIVVGDGGVGKSTMIQRLTTGQFIPMKITIGTDLVTHDVKISDTELAKLQIWDFGGEKRFRFFLPNYCRGAVGCLLCYDITRFRSLENLDEWINIVKENTVDPVIILVGQKQDLADEKRVVRVSDAEEFQQKYSLPYFYETSSKSGYNNELIFRILTKAIIVKQKKIL